MRFLFLLLEVAAQVIRKVPGAIRDWNPALRYHTFGDYCIQAKVILRVDEYANTAPVKHEFIKLLHRKFQEEKIEVPFPPPGYAASRTEARK